uniref:Embryonic testis differentiation protein homolog A n=1 Tax=Prolemur simus TaxID=1328070 RepID=A0A8C8YDL7_PROSS
MEQEHSKVPPKEPALSIKRKSRTSSPHPQVSKNVLYFLIGRQLERPRHDIDLAQWVWMLT